MSSVPVVRVALPTPLRRLFDYRAERPGGIAAAMEPGRRVRVPFGRQQLIGIAMEVAAGSELPDERLKPVFEVLDPQPIFHPATLSLLGWAAEYYHHPIGEVLATALPKALRLGAALECAEERWLLTPEGGEAAARGEPRRAPRQRQLLAALTERGAPDCGSGERPRAPAPGLTAAELDEKLESWREAARALFARGWLVRVETAPAGAAMPSSAPIAMSPGPEPNEEQRAAIATVCDSLGTFGGFVLHGVTGSGKTEVYLRVVERALGLGRSALVLVPEIGLTPQLVGRFRQRFAVPMAVLHSALTDHERLLAWREAFSGRARIVLGTRSAVFAPAQDLGVIIVDEEHDTSFKQHEGGFRYSARDLAVVRAQRAGVPVVLGSATPALETLQNVTTGRYTRLPLTRRAAEAVPPRLSLIDLRTSAVRAGISTPAVQAIERHLEAGGQVLVFLNRRGYAPTLLCTACGWIAPCRDCDARLTVHLGAGRLRCHHCGADTALPERCPQCGFAVKTVGQGTERIEETLAALFPGITCIRLDRDVVRRRGDMEEAMRRMASGEARILIGTQMVTKGHDFPNVTLVVVLNADQGFFSTDFRAPERLAQTIVQVAGRAGRGEKAGEVLIQTEFPDHPLLLSLLADGYEGFARAALAERSQASWPPFSRLAAVRDSATTPEAALAFLTEARRTAEDLRSDRGGSGSGSRATGRAIRLLGPAPAAMAKRAGRHHAQLLLESTDRTALHRFLEAWLPVIESLPSARRVRWALDVDPIELF
ncbi:MAG TPA: primosomal protein N' [Steroidobacteraceae bacterium]|nr:primosomal protein N' [Steroidobacteraceae bacterium]